MPPGSYTFAVATLVVESGGLFWSNYLNISFLKIG